MGGPSRTQSSSSGPRPMVAEDVVKTLMRGCSRTHSVESATPGNRERNPNVLRGYVAAPSGASGMPTHKAMTSARCAAVLSLSAVIGAIAFGVPALAPADAQCPDGLVPREARPGDQVCVTNQVAAEIAQENANAANVREPGGGAYGPNTCKQGYVWREAFDGDTVCVVPQRRQETWHENAGAGYGPTGGAPYGTKPPGVSVPVPVVPIPGGPSAPVGTPARPTPGAPPPPGSPGQSHPPPPGGTTSNAPLPTPQATPTTTKKPSSCDPKVDICVN